MSPLAQNLPFELTNIFLILNYTKPLAITGFEQLSSSICCRVIAGQVWPQRANYAFSEKLGIRPKTGYLAHNFGHRCASKSIKRSIDADCHLVFNKTLSQKNGSMGWGPGPAKDGLLFQNMSSLRRHLPKTPPKQKIVFFSILTTRLAESVQGLNSSLAQPPGEL